ncbi:MAG: bifunctional nuclease family protein [Pseudomonadota bacterium]
MLIPVSVAGLALDPRTESPILLLRDDANQRVLPIWIGIAEATAIAAKVENIELPRPMTHDLTQSLVDKLGGRIGRVAITSLRDSTFYASVFVLLGEVESAIDARPSDAVALALRANAPIFVDDQVFVDGSSVVVSNAALVTEEEPVVSRDEAVQQTAAERWSTLLEHMEDEDPQHD